MFLKQMLLKNFRNFGQETFEFNPHLTIIIGENARGKTNLLESIFFVIHGEGFRETKEEELIAFNQTLTQVAGAFTNRDNTITYQIMLKKTADTVAKVFFTNKTKRRYIDYQKESTKAVLFSPEQIAIMTGSPDKRRKYFDSVLREFDIEYKKKLAHYETALRKRNKILEHHVSESQLRKEISFWNDYLAEQARYITAKREEYLNFLNRHTKIDNREFHIEYVRNEFTKERLTEKYDLELRVRKTMIGPQKDDFHVYQVRGKEKKNLQHYGSRSEQRLGMFWLKLDETLYIENQLKLRPILLLDDILSELDKKNKKLVIDLIQKYQTVITTTETELIDLAKMQKSLIKL
ncbi:hypothetical protein A3C28_00975 [Candidatus Roizmanbacteria bacterium RIFCSPHIGHO2_02_FULL_39_9]|uniref:DNA replication and repair protein RecF n=3 Tax=Candidatus Roizmaniibacteriota TaxID=1752723 RepID=A0A1F7I2N3_9BACT|nr:MAG: hypothetical protein A3C28_00975 [Candidatus Roizmanbacteria bacterium RIFCSPHIGHO2_02_FULL_39_9]OGK37616.1 MAG: hypothetical protein A3F60_01835 [Candidatus Roizmanbacteria bacterium RIFCSPHIGHO2_12_FULL_39_8]